MDFEILGTLTIWIVQHRKFSNVIGLNEALDPNGIIIYADDKRGNMVLATSLDKGPPKLYIFGASWTCGREETTEHIVITGVEKINPLARECAQSGREEVLARFHPFYFAQRPGTIQRVPMPLDEKCTGEGDDECHEEQGNG